MQINLVYKRLIASVRDPDMRAKVLALVGGKAIGLMLRADGDEGLSARRRCLAQAPAAGAVAGGQRDQHRLDARSPPSSCSACRSAS